MTVTRDQAQILATLAVACRPHRAPTWDADGVMAAIAEVKHLSLPEVVLAVIRAAADRDAQTPGVIPKLTGSHWSEQLKPPLWQPAPWDPADICTTCSQRRSVCEARPRVADDDHEFVSRATHAAESARPFEAVERIVADLRQRTADEPPERGQPEAGTEGTDRVAPIRAALHPTPTTAGDAPEAREEAS